MDVNQLNKHQLTPLQELCRSTASVSSETKIDMAITLLQAQAKASWGEVKIIFKWCCERDDVGRVSQLMSMKIPIQEKEGKDSIFHFAVQAFAKQNLNYLLKIPSLNVNLRNEKLETALFMLCNSYVHDKKEIIVDMMKALLIAKANPNISADKTPLVALFTRFWHNHTNQVTIQSSKQKHNVVSSSFKASDKKKLCKQLWQSNSHDPLKSLIILFHQHGAQLTPLINHLETSIWQEQVDEVLPPPIPYTHVTREKYGIKYGKGQRPIIRQLVPTPLLLFLLIGNLSLRT